MMRFPKKSASYTSTPSVSRLTRYIQKAVEQDGVIEVSRLMNSFLRRTNITACLKTQRAWISEIKREAKNHGLYFFISHDNNLNKTEKVTRHREVPTKEYALKGNVYTEVLKKALRKRNIDSVDVYGALKEAGFNTRTSERKVSILKKAAYQYGLVFFKDGRNLMVSFSKVVPFPVSSFLKNTPQKKELLYNNKLKREKYINKNTGKPAFRLNKNLNKKAHWLTKQLKFLIWDNCKVEFHYGICFNFVKWALLEGFKDTIILQYFSAALKKRHGDATDMGLNCGNPRLKFKLSSTISLTKEMLMERFSQDSKAQRFADTISLIKERKKSKSAEGIEQKTIVHLKSKQETVYSPTPAAAVSFEDVALNRGFSKNQISVFNAFTIASLPVKNAMIEANPGILQLLKNLASIHAEAPLLSA